MDMSFARRNRAASRSPINLARPAALDLSRRTVVRGNQSDSTRLMSLLARVAARQAVTPTAKIHALTENILPQGEINCAGVSVFAPARTGVAQRVSASFNANAAAIISSCKHS